MVTEKWRYRCPDCGSSQLKQRYKPRQAKEVVADKRMHSSNWTYNTFYCRHCQTPHETIYDAKRDREVYPGAVNKRAIPHWHTTIHGGDS